MAAHQRVVEEQGRRLAAQEAGEPQLHRGGVEEVAAADDQVDSVPHVVDDHAERIRPVADAVADEEIATRRRLLRERAREQVGPALRARPDGHPQAQGFTRAPVLLQ